MPATLGARVPQRHSLVRVTQELDAVVRERLRSLRLARGWSLDALARRCGLSPSTLSRLETGGRRIALDQLVPLAQALGTTLDQLVEPAREDDVVIRPVQDEVRGATVWTLARERAPYGLTVARMVLTQPPPPQGPGSLGTHPGRDWFLVLSGTVHLRLGERSLLVPAGSAAEFSTATPHAMGAHGGPAELLTILTEDGERAHLHDDATGAAPDGAHDGPDGGPHGGPHDHR